MATCESNVVYDVEHLATFSTQSSSLSFDRNDTTTGNNRDETNADNDELSSATNNNANATTPKLALQRLFDLEKSSGIWTQRMQIELKDNYMLIVDCETESTVERFPMSYIQQPGAFNHSNHIYNNIILFTIQNPSDNGPGELHIFQCVSHQAQQVVDDILNWNSGSKQSFNKDRTNDQNTTSDGSICSASNNWSSTKNDDKSQPTSNNKETNNGNNKSSSVNNTSSSSSKVSSVSSVTTANNSNNNNKIPVVNVNVKETVNVFNQIAAQREKAKPTSPTTVQPSTRPNVVASQQITPSSNRSSSNSGRSSQASPTNYNNSNTDNNGQQTTEQSLIQQHAVSPTSPITSSSSANNSTNNKQQQQMPTIPYGTRAVLDHHLDSRSSIITNSSNDSALLAPITGAVSNNNQQLSATNMPVNNKQHNHHHQANSVNGQQQRQQHHHHHKHNSQVSAMPIEMIPQQQQHHRNINVRHQMPHLSATIENNGAKKASISRPTRRSLSPQSVTQADFMADQVASNDTETTKSYVSVLNHCFDDIEKFIMRLQHAAAAQRELQTRRNMRRSSQTQKSTNGMPGDGLLASRARGPNEDDFYEILCKFKLAFNLLAKLKGCIHDPNAPELVHFLFTPLAIIIDAARNSGPMPIDPTIVGVPYLNQDAIDLLSNCCTSKESDIWISLGPNWTQMIDPHLLQTSRLPSSFQPVFSDGWAPLITELELIGLVLPVAVPLMPVDMSIVEDNGLIIPSGQQHINNNNHRVSGMIDIDSDNNSTITDSPVVVPIQSNTGSAVNQQKGHHHHHHQQTGRHPRSSVPPPPLPKDNDLMPTTGSVNSNSDSGAKSSRGVRQPQSFGHSHHHNVHQHQHDASDTLRYHQHQLHHDDRHHRQTSRGAIGGADNCLRDDISGSGHSRDRTGYLPSTVNQLRSNHQRPQQSHNRHQNKSMPRPPSPMDSVDGEENLLCSTMDAFDDVQLDWIADLQARNAKIVRVLFPREANNEKELTVHRNEILEILDDSRKWWKARNIKSEIAHVPHTIVTELSAPMQLMKNAPGDYHLRDQRDHHMHHHMINSDDNNIITSPSSSYINNSINNNNNAEWSREEKRGKAGGFRYF